MNPAYRGRRVLITGASGFIGRHLLAALRASQARCAVLLRRPHSDLQAEKFFLADLRQPQLVVRAVAAWQPDFVFHLAASRERSLAPSAFKQTLANNLAGTLHLLQAVAEQTRGDLRRVVLLGTAEEYGRQDAPFREDAREAPTSAYSLSKLACTHLAQLMARSCGLPVTVLRPSLAYGPGQRQDMFLPALIMALLRRRPFPMSPGQQTRDFLYVDDLVEALLLAGTARGVIGEVINIGSGSATRIADLVQQLEQLLDAPGMALRGALGYRTGEAMDYRLNTSKAHTLLGWRARTSLQLGLQRSLRWYAEHG